MSKPWFRKKKSPADKTFDEISTIDNLPNYGFQCFRAYFPEDSADVDRLLKHLQYVLKFIGNHKSLFSIEDIVINKFFTIDINILLEDEQLLIDWPNFSEVVIDNCDYCMKCLGLAMNQFILDRHEEIHADNYVKVPIIQARIINVEPHVQLKDLKVNYYSKLVTVKGTVIKAGQVKLVCQYLAFQCASCEGTQMITQSDGGYTLPTKCLTRGCHSQKNFIPLHISPYNRIITWQSIKIQELMGNEQCDSARIPRSLDCELTEDLVKCCIPGDDVTLTGIVKVRDANSNNGCNKQHTIFNLYLEAISICNDKKQSRRDVSSEGMTFNVSDCHLIQEIHSHPNLFKFLVHCICPSICGHEIVKAGLLLSLFGGTKSETFRGESHVLIVGDPGLGKSQMLQACANVAPRGIYVCGNTSTSSGLTVSVTREGNEFAMEAGALMLADQGCCCIDEFDKMPSQHACLLEAMEQQSISVAKAGIVCNLPTRASILAAANPAGGHYNKAKTIAENLKISSPMLSRFDLIFILLDQPNEQMDLLLSKHVLGLHKAARIKTNVEENTFEESDMEQDSLRPEQRLN
ncbi:unnamed protein product [Acanthoscelides obtectus]|uniref:DNA helicase MCM8 n=1 Tax=Acanthoscelides obtectus TaxID=200917 RepID=A0A9P0KMV1_ACAOB|nr:unnamed protein product [Acanthoscelides obtectus]CAK1682047.1 DNA helicase MCM8 [Acanthoscelides obtectus]